MSSPADPARQHIVLGNFLRAHRESLTPADVGLELAQPRKELCLSRDEVAQLAGISAAYLARLEQGAATRASIAALNGLGRALKLDREGREHLFRLAETATTKHHQE